MADVAEAFLNDPYHPDGTAKPSIVCSTEADSDAALTMQILKHLSGTPVLFADVRHYHADRGASGTSAIPASTLPGSPRGATSRRRTSATYTSTPRSSSSRRAGPPCT